jgi:hypothetical protein
MPEHQTGASCRPQHRQEYGSLRRSACASLRGLTIEENESEVVILGLVTSYYQKQLAQEALMPLLGARRLSNRVEVKAPDGRRTPRSPPITWWSDESRACRGE